MFGTQYKKCYINTKKPSANSDFVTIVLEYPEGTAIINAGNGVKSEGDLVISGTKGYIYVPAPWWKTDYFEIRYENPANNRKYFYQLDGEGIRYEIVNFLRSIKNQDSYGPIDNEVSITLSKILEKINKQEEKGVK